MGSPGLARAKVEQRGKFSDRGEQIQDKGVGVGHITKCFEGIKGNCAFSLNNNNTDLLPAVALMKLTPSGPPRPLLPLLQASLHASLSVPCGEGLGQMTPASVHPPSHTFTPLISSIEGLPGTCPCAASPASGQLSLRKGYLRNACVPVVCVGQGEGR